MKVNQLGTLGGDHSSHRGVVRIDPAGQLPGEHGLGWIRLGRRHVGHEHAGDPAGAQPSQQRPQVRFILGRWHPVREVGRGAVEKFVDTTGWEPGYKNSRDAAAFLKSEYETARSLLAELGMAAAK